MHKEAPLLDDDEPPPAPEAPEVWNRALGPLQLVPTRKHEPAIASMAEMRTVEPSWDMP